MKSNEEANNDLFEEIKKIKELSASSQLKIEKNSADIEKIYSCILEQKDTIDKIFKAEKKVIPYISDIPYEKLRRISKIYEVNLTKIFEGIESIELPIGIIDEGSGHINQVNLLYVVAIAQYRKCKNIFEFGTWLGKTTYHLASIANDVKVTTLDLPPEESLAGDSLGSYFKGTNKREQINQILCNSQKFDASPYKNKMDLIFVDGDHDYEGIANDTNKAFEMLAPGGIILWDDYEPKNLDIVKFFSKFTINKPVFRIKRTCLLMYIDGVDASSFKVPKE